MRVCAFCRALLQESITVSRFLNDYDSLIGDLMLWRGALAQHAHQKSILAKCRGRHREASAVTSRVLTKTHFTVQRRQRRVAWPRGACDCGNTKGTDKNKFQLCKSARV
jgi:hypothetical protein